MFKTITLKRTFVLLLILCCSTVSATPYKDVRKRILKDIDKGKPIVAHISVALADNKYQWIARVPDKIGNGQQPQNNLYWGALYGLKTFLTKKKRWKLTPATSTKDKAILERIVLLKTFTIINGKKTDFYVVADAWDGKTINKAVEKFAAHASGNTPETITINNTKVHAGSNAHLIGYIGHDILMDYNLSDNNTLTEMPKLNSIHPQKDNPAKSTIVLACQSNRYFKEKLLYWNVNPLILTNSNMAPEAYTVDAILNSFAKQATAKQIHESAAQAYNKYQKCGINSARKLFYFSK